MDKRPHVIWITLESVRWDHTTMGGYKRDTTPNIQNIANETGSQQFDRCFSQAIWTAPSSASMLTGTYMSTHQVGKEGTGERTLPAELRTLPELFGDEGYRTACFSPNAYLSPATKLNRGFDDFYWLKVDQITDIGWGPILKYIYNMRSHGPGFSRDTRKHNLSYFLTEGAKKWIRADTSNPSFLYLHYGNPHHPYFPPKGWRDQFTSDIEMHAKEAMELVDDIFETQSSMKRTIANGCDISSQELAAIEAMYDAEIAYADDRIGHFYEYAKSNLDGEVVFIITADHGECFGERNVLGHNLIVNDTLTHVPLVTNGIDGLADRTDSIIQHVDISRTVAGLIDAQEAQFEGIDLRETSPDEALSQHGLTDFEPYTEHNADFDVDAFHAEYVGSLRTSEYRYVRSTEKIDLYALPDETNSITAEKPDVVERLDARFSELPGWTDDTDLTSEQAEFSGEMEQQLENLGYL